MSLNQQSKFVIVGGTFVRKSAITHFRREPTRKTDNPEAEKYPYSLVVCVTSFHITNCYASEEDRDRDFEELAKTLEEE